jgi:hypothetical protein
VAETTDDVYKTKERDLYGREPIRDDKHKDVAVRDGRVEIIRPVEVRTREVEKSKAYVPTDIGDRDRDGNRPEPLPVEVKKQEVSDRKAPKPAAKVEPERAAPKPKQDVKKVDIKQPARDAKEPKEAPKVQIKRSGTTSSSGTKRVAPKVRTDSSKGRSPSKRRSISR